MMPKDKNLIKRAKKHTKMNVKKIAEHRRRFNYDTIIKKHIKIRNF